MHLRNARIAVQQGSPTYHKASAALTQLASDCRLLSDSCEAAVQGSAGSQSAPTAIVSSTAHSKEGMSVDQSTVLSPESSPLDVIIDGLILRIDESEASCARFQYDSGTAAVSMKDARLNIFFKVNLRTSAKLRTFACL